MAKQKTIQKIQSNVISNIKKDFKFLIPKIKSKLVHSVLLYGSYATNEQTPRSDIDICIVTLKLKTAKEQAKLLSYIWQNIDANKYDIRIFEDFPLYIKISVIENYKVIFSNSHPELSYYFYFFRKLWNDQSVNWIER